MNSNEKDDLDDLINPNDFQSLEFEIKLTSTIAGKTYQENIHVLELQESGLVLEIPEKTCAAGHHMKIEMTLSNGLQINGTSKIESVKNLGNKRDQVTMKLIQFNKEIWEEIKDTLKKKEESIQKLLTDSES